MALYRIKFDYFKAGARKLVPILGRDGVVIEASSEKDAVERFNATLKPGEQFNPFYLDVKREPGSNPVRKTAKSKRAARALVKRYGSKARAREVAGGMIGTAATRKQREHFVRVRKSINPKPRFLKESALYIWHYAPRGEGLEFGLDAVTPVLWEIGKRAPKKAQYIFRIPDEVTASPTFKLWLSKNGPQVIESKNILARRFKEMAQTSRNPRHRMPITPEDRGILRAMTKEHGKRAVARAAMRSNPLPMFPMYVRKGSGKWSMVAVFNKLDNARTVGNLIRLRGYQVRVTDGKD